ncbi:MAG: TetR/AcrR family transcriptional regulator [Myxococcales bacterium]|nr:TetR/AcrR family transcriptional regulator [Myxococcales bacterium]
MERERLTGKAATQERILVAARKLFLGKGYESTTVAEIADAAEVSRATVFWHFNDKASLFRETFTRLLAPFRESLDRNLEEVDAEKRLHELVAIYESFSTDHLAEIGGFVRWAVETPTFRSLLVTTLLDLHQRFIGSLSQAIAEIVAPSQDPRILATGLMSLLDGNLLLSLFDETPSIMETRRASVQAFVALIPRRNRGR